MKKLIIFLALLSIYCLPCTYAYAAEPPKRIISLAPNLTEILFALGLEDKIAGVTDFCDYPERAREKKTVGGMSNPSLETVVSMKPDMVVMTTDGNPREIEERLRSLNIATYVFRAKRISELPQAIREIGIALEVKERAEVLAADIEKTLARFSSRKSEAQNPWWKALFVVWPEPLIAAGPGTVIDDALKLTGLKNIASEAKTAYPKYSIEELLRQKPDLIFIGKGHKDMARASKGLLARLKTLHAVKNKKVFYVSDDLYRLGPRTISGIAEISLLLDQNP